MTIFGHNAVFLIYFIIMIFSDIQQYNITDIKLADLTNINFLPYLVIFNIC